MRFIEDCGKVLGAVTLFLKKNNLNRTECLLCILYFDYNWRIQMVLRKTQSLQLRSWTLEFTFPVVTPLAEWHWRDD